MTDSKPTDETKKTLINIDVLMPLPEPESVRAIRIYEEGSCEVLEQAKNTLRAQVATLEARVVELERERDHWCDMHTVACADRDRLTQQLAACEKGIKEARDWIGSRPHGAACTFDCICWKSRALDAIDAAMSPDKQ